MNTQFEMDILKQQYLASLKALPGVQAGHSDPQVLASLCAQAGRNKEVALKLAQSAMLQGKSFERGTPSSEKAFDAADAFYYYHDYLLEVEKYEEECRARAEMANMSLA